MHHIEKKWGEVTGHGPGLIIECMTRPSGTSDSLNWTQLERELLRTLAIQVKYLTPAQIQTGWGEQAAATIQSLLQAELVVEETLEVYKFAAPVAPLFAWSPGQPPPSREHLRVLSDQLLRRGSGRLTPQLVFRASRSAANAFGARSNEPDRSSEWSHDLFISEVYLYYRARRQDEVAAWYGESFLPKLGFVIKNMKDPDAFLVKDQSISRIIEIGGRYSVEHLEALHEHCAGGALRRIKKFAASHDAAPQLRLYDQELIPYEIW